MALQTIRSNNSLSAGSTFLPLTWKHSEVGTPEAVAHSVGSHADIHAGIFLLGSGYQKLVEV